MRLILLLAALSVLACAGPGTAATSPTGCLGDRSAVVSNSGPYDVDIVVRHMNGRDVVLGTVASGERREFPLEAEHRQVSYTTSRNTLVSGPANIEIRVICRPRPVPGVTGS